METDKKAIPAANRYTLTFTADQLPTVNAFWSVTTVRRKDAVMIDNPINRYLNQLADACPA